MVNKRNQENLIPEALRAIGCTYLAYQSESYFKCKGKNYDGSSSLKMIGNDCKLIELNMKKFLTTFIKADSKEIWNSKSFEKLRQVNKLYRLFGDLARDIRSTTANKEWAASFSTRAERFFQKLKTWSGRDSVYGKPYLHVLRDHIGNYMVQWANLVNWGYGLFSCSAGEHLNKTIKVQEMEHTNFDQRWFEVIMRNLQLKQFYYTETIWPTHKEVTCSKCQQKGHNKKISRVLFILHNHLLCLMNRIQNKTKDNTLMSQIFTGRSFHGFWTNPQTSSAKINSHKTLLLHPLAKINSL